jgi:hypothetical protein
MLIQKLNPKKNPLIRGKFAVRLEDQFLMNVDAHTTKEQLKKLLQEFQGVGVVTVTYSDEDDR